MIAIRNILCPVDFSEYSRHAADHAFALARWYGSTVTLLHVAPTIPAAAFAAQGGVLEPPPLAAADRERLIASLKEFALRASGVSLETVVREGTPATEILRQAEGMHADLLTIATHGRSGFEALVLGSVTEKIVRKAACPVLTVPPRAPNRESTAPVTFRRILCPVDFSGNSRHALNYALSIAQEADADLTVLHVTEYDLQTTPDMYDSSITDRTLSLPEFRQKREQLAQQHLNDLIPDSARLYCTIETKLVLDGRPYREILRIAEEGHSDLIVMGVHGRGAAIVMFFGSTTQQVVRHASCPVLTLREE